MKFNATHHITIIWRAISNQTPIRFLQIATEKNRLKMRSNLWPHAIWSYHNIPSPLSLWKQKKQTFDTQFHSIWFGDQLSYDNLNYLAKCFCRFFGVFAVLLVFVGIVLSDYVFLTSTFVVKLWLFCIFNQYLYALFDIVHIFRNSNLPPIRWYSEIACHK